MNAIVSSMPSIFDDQQDEATQPTVEEVLKDPALEKPAEEVIGESDVIDLTADEVMNMDPSNPPQELLNALANQAKRFRDDIAAKNKQTDFVIEVHTKGLFNPAKHVFIGTGSPAKKFDAELEKFLQECTINPPLAPKGAELSDHDKKRNKLLRVMINTAMNHQRFKSVKYRDIGPKLPRDLVLSKVIEPFILRHMEYLIGAAPYYDITL